LAISALVVFALSGCMSNKEIKLMNASGVTKYCCLASETLLLAFQAHGEYARSLNDAGGPGYRKTKMNKSAT
jgi:hypothetical protein